MWAGRKNTKETPLYEYKMEHNIIDIPLDQYIIHNTRCSRKHNSQFLQIRHSSNTFGKSFVPTTAKEWNALPSDIISSSSIESFKTKLSKYLLDHSSTHHHAHWRDVPEGHYLPVMQQKQKLWHVARLFTKQS